MFKKLTKKTKDKESEWTKHDDKVLQAIEAGDTEKLQTSLTKKGTSAIKMSPDGKVPLHEAARLGQDGCLKVLLQTGVGVAVSDTQGLTPLHYTAMGGYVIPTQRLLHVNASVRAKDLMDKTPLHYAVLGGHLDVTQLLLEAKADIDAKEEYGKTPLMITAQQGHLILCKELIDKGANVNAQEHLLKTSLMIACEHAHSKVVDLLIKHGARVDLQDNQGFDVAYYAETCGEEAVKSHLAAAPSVATWDVGNDDEEEDKQKADAVDYIARFEDSNDRSVSPIAVCDAKTPAERNVKTNGLSKDEEIKELEEENDVLNEELKELNMEHKRAVDRIASMEQQIQQLTSGVKENTNNQEYENELEMVKALLVIEKKKNTEANIELERLRSTLDSIDAGGVNGDDDGDDADNDSWGDSDDGDDADNDSWGDSDDGGLFDLPGTGVSQGKVKILRKSSVRSGESDNKVLASLRGQVAVMKEENEDLKRRIQNGDSDMIPKSEYKDLRSSTESRITTLEEEIADLKDELKQQSEMVPAETYNTLRMTKKRESQIMQDQLALLADEMASTTEKLAHVTGDKNRLKRRLNEQNQILDSNQQYREVLKEKSELEEAINKYTISLADQSDEMQRMHKKNQLLMADKKDLQDKLSQQELAFQVKTEEYETLEMECRRSENKVSKQSKAIAAQNDRARQDKKTLVDLMSEKESLAEELHKFKRETHVNGDVGSISKSRYDELLEENSVLKETVVSQEGMLQGSQGDRDRLEFLSKENWRLQASLRRQEDTMSKKHAELMRYKKLVRPQGDSGMEAFAKHLEELDAENLKLQEELDQCKEEGVNKCAELTAENERLREQVKTTNKLSPKTAVNDKQHLALLEENAKLKEKVKQVETSKQLANGRTSDEEAETLRKEVDSLNAKILETVRVYRTHLLSAVQGNMDQEVKTALLEIVKLRDNGHNVI